MVPTVAQLKSISLGSPTAANMQSIVQALSAYGQLAGLDLPHRLAHFLAQIAEESGGFHYDREIWGPTPAQKRYEGRADLGNAQPGDGEKFAGRGPIQITGRANVTEFHSWAVARGYNPPDFVANPDLINTDPWEGLSAIWFWTTRKLNPLADANDIEQITKKINGGLNGYADRLRYYTRAGLVLLGFGPDQVKEFQARAQAKGYLPSGAKQIDGDAGPKTRAAIHKMLADKSTVIAPAVAESVKAAPVTSPEAVVPKGAEKRKGIWTWGPLGLLAGAGNVFAPVLGLPWQVQVVLAIIVVAAVVFFLVKGELIVRRVKTLIAEIEG